MDMDPMGASDRSLNEHVDEDRLHSMMVTPELMEMLPGASNKYG